MVSRIQKKKQQEKLWTHNDEVSVIIHCLQNNLEIIRIFYFGSSKYLDYVRQLDRLPFFVSLKLLCVSRISIVLRIVFFSKLSNVQNDWKQLNYRTFFFYSIENCLCEKNYQLILKECIFHSLVCGVLICKRFGRSDVKTVCDIHACLCCSTLWQSKTAI